MTLFLEDSSRASIAPPPVDSFMQVEELLIDDEALAYEQQQQQQEQEQEQEKTKHVLMDEKTPFETGLTHDVSMEEDIIYLDEDALSIRPKQNSKPKELSSSSRVAKSEEEDEDEETERWELEQIKKGSIYSAAASEIYQQMTEASMATQKERRLIFSQDFDLGAVPSLEVSFSAIQLELSRRKAMLESHAAAMDRINDRIEAATAEVSRLGEKLADMGEKYTFFNTFRDFLDEYTEFSDKKVNEAHFTFIYAVTNTYIHAYVRADGNGIDSGIGSTSKRALCC